MLLRAAIVLATPDNELREPDRRLSDNGPHDRERSTDRHDILDKGGGHIFTERRGKARPHRSTTESSQHGADRTRDQTRNQ